LSTNYREGKKKPAQGGARLGRYLGVTDRGGRVVLNRKPKRLP